MTQGSPQSLASVIDALVRQLGIHTKLKQYDIVDVWGSIVGAQIASVTSIDKIERNVLVVKVTAAPWRTELTFRRSEILDKIHAAMNSDAIKDIRFR
jgi:predicted nucleic acid-binding Zn ribbon protein